MPKFGETTPGPMLPSDPTTGHASSTDLTARWTQLRRWVEHAAAQAQQTVAAATLDQVLGEIAHLEDDWPIAQDEPQIDIPDTAWKPVGDEELPGGEQAKLTTTITIAGTDMHLDAWQITPGDAGQGALQDDDGLSEVAFGVGADGHFETTTIGGREYVIVATPYC